MGSNPERLLICFNCIIRGRTNGTWLPATLSCFWKTKPSKCHEQSRLEIPCSWEYPSQVSSNIFFKYNVRNLKKTQNNKSRQCQSVPCCSRSGGDEKAGTSSWILGLSLYFFAVGWCWGGGVPDYRHAREDSLKEMVTEKERKDQRVFKYLEFIGFFTELLKAMSPDTSWTLSKIWELQLLKPICFWSNFSEGVPPAKSVPSIWHLSTFKSTVKFRRAYQRK